MKEASFGTLSLLQLKPKLRDTPFLSSVMVLGLTQRGESPNPSRIPFLIILSLNWRSFDQITAVFLGSWPGARLWLCEDKHRFHDSYKNIPLDQWASILILKLWSVQALASRCMFISWVKVVRYGLLIHPSGVLVLIKKLTDAQQMIDNNINGYQSH